MILAQKIDQLGFAQGRPVVATIGNFDALHRGHRALFEKVLERAAARQALPAVVTFDPHPRRLLDPEHAPRLILTRAQKIELIRSFGFEALAIIPFDRQLAAMPAEEFAREILCRRLGLVEIYVGHDFRFGRGRAGDVALLNLVGRDCHFTAATVPAVIDDGEPISTSRIRRCLSEGKVAAAARLLGRPFYLVGTIVHGEGRGGNVLVPTANLAPENEFLPARGVYITRTHLAQGFVPGLTNVGLRPTFGDHRMVVETFLPGFEGDIYGQRVDLEFVERLREERKFASVDELMAQIRKDLAAFEEWQRE